MKLAMVTVFAVAAATVLAGSPAVAQTTETISAAATSTVRPADAPDATPEEDNGTNRPITSTTYEYKYINVSRAYNWTHRGRQLGICKVESGAGGGTCTISRTYSVGTTIQSDFGVSTASVAANIGISATKTVTGMVSWTSPKAPVGSQYKAWAVGTLVTYQIQKWKVSKAGGITARSLVGTSATLGAFSPVVGFAVGQ